MNPPWRRFFVHAVFWRRLLRFAVLNVPLSVEPVILASWSFLFLLWGSGRRGVMRNLTAIKPGSTPIANFFRTWRVFWNFAWTITDTMRLRELRTIPDWEFTGSEHFETLRQLRSGAIILTAHMGSYDLGAQLFSETSGREMVMVRAPEIDPETNRFEEEHRERTAASLRIDFNTDPTGLALGLLSALREGQIIAIQGDRVTPGVSSVETTLFGRRARIPAGPFALAMAARAPIFPLFIIRIGRRRYRMQACAPMTVERRSRNRDEDLRRAIDAWARQLEDMIGGAWHQWFAFAPFDEEQAA